MSKMVKVYSVMSEEGLFTKNNLESLKDSLEYYSDELEMNEPTSDSRYEKWEEKQSDLKDLIDLVDDLMEKDSITKDEKDELSGSLELFQFEHRGLKGLKMVFYDKQC